MATVEPATLTYADLDTQFGVICDNWPDGGVVLTIPDHWLSQITRRLEGRAHPVVSFVMALFEIVRRLFRLPLQPRAIIELTPDSLTITETVRGESSTPLVRTWAFADVGELRANRYSKGLYVRIPGKDNFDLLSDLDQKLLEHVGQTLSDALTRLKAAKRA